MTERAVLLLRRRRPTGEPAAAEGGSMPGFSTVRGSTGAGRVLHSLAELGLAFRTVTQSVHDPGVTAEAVVALEVGGSFDVVILGSHLVNTPDEALRRAWLRAAARHVSGRGVVLVEHHPVDWAETAADEPAIPGGSLGMVEVRRDPPFVSAVSVVDAGGREVRQPFTALVLSEAELDAALAAAGLVRGARLGPTWLEAHPADSR